MKSHITGFQHIGIPVKDLERTISFYRKLGFNISHKAQTNDSDPIQVAFLKLESMMIEIYQVSTTVNRTGAIDHFALDVIDIDSLFCDLKERNFKFLSDDIQDLPFWEKGIRFFCIEGPDAEIIEFCERLQ